MNISTTSQSITDDQELAKVLAGIGPQVGTAASQRSQAMMSGQGAGRSSLSGMSDDKSLIDPAYQIAKSIRDETRRAQALLDIIKEIDYLSQR